MKTNKPFMPIQFNPQAFLESLSYFAFAGVMLYLVKTGRYLSYVTPRMHPYLLFVALCMGIWGLLSLRNLLRPQHVLRAAHCLVLVVPLLLFLLPHTPGRAVSQGVGYDLGNLQAENGIGQANQGQVAVPDSMPLPANSADSSGYQSYPAAVPDEQKPSVTADADDSTGLDTANRSIRIDYDNYVEWMRIFYREGSTYEGYTVSLTGFSITEGPTLMEDEFVIARLVMTCCAADLTPAGLLCQTDIASIPESGSWAKVEGRLHIVTRSHEGKTYRQPMLQGISLETAEEDSRYLYLY